MTWRGRNPRHGGRAILVADTHRNRRDRFSLVGAFYVLREHWGHALGALPYLLILAFRGR